MNTLSPIISVGAILMFTIPKPTISDLCTAGGVVIKVLLAILRAKRGILKRARVGGIAIWRRS